MTAPTARRITPTPVSGWGDDREWLTARSRGISASDVAAILGFSEYATPWEVWADKTGLRPRQVDANKEAIRLGIALEPWLIVQARHHLGVPVVHTQHRLYAHPQAQWQLASPDAEVRPDDGEPYGFEGKTSGLGGGFGIPKGWSDDWIPLGHELQARWQMRIMGWRKVILGALVAGLGLRFYTVHRDEQIETDLVTQVADWYKRHLVDGVEPPMSAKDSTLINDVWPEPTAGHLPLDDNPDIVDLVLDYQAGLMEERAGKDRKDTAAAAIKRIIGPHCGGTIDGREVITWNPKRGTIRWREFIADLYAISGWEPDDIERDGEPYRTPPTRTISVKGIK